MTLPFKITAVAALLLAAALPAAQAQSQTDEVLVLNLQLGAISQGPTTSAKGVVATQVRTSEVTSRDVIQAIGASTGNSFSTHARLELLTPTNDLEFWSVQVRDGSSLVDVSGFFVHQRGSASVSSAFVVNRTGDAGDVEYSIDNFSLVDQPGFPALSLHFNVSGLTVTSQSGVVNRRGQVVGQVDDISGQVSGTGDSNGALIIIQGTIHAEGTGTQTITTAPPGVS